MDDDTPLLPISAEPQLRFPDADTRGHCVGCGYFHYCNGFHRADCTNPTRTFLHVEGADRCPMCSWHTPTQGHHPHCLRPVENEFT
jgi:hypothetical protein